MGSGFAQEVFDKVVEDYPKITGSKQELADAVLFIINKTRDFQRTALTREIMGHLNDIYLLAPVQKLTAGDKAKIRKNPDLIKEEVVRTLQELTLNTLSQVAVIEDSELDEKERGRA
jgi:hypothetical protein